MTEKQIILKLLEPKFKQASIEKLWFINLHNPEQFFSPDEMRSHLHKSKYVIDPHAWEVTCPKKRMKEIDKDISFAHQEISDLLREKNNISKRVFQ